MIDGIIKGDGTSRFLAGSLPATYEEFKQLVEQKKLPVDLLFNPAGWSQLPTFLNKANLFSDPAAEKYGAGVVTPDAAFSFLGQYALHWWKRKTLGYYEATWTIPTGTGNQNQGISGIINTSVVYSSELEVDENGNVVLKNPSSISASLIGAYQDELRGKFCLTYYNLNPAPSVLTPTSVIPTNATYTIVSGTSYLYGYTASSYYRKNFVNTEVAVDFSVPAESGGSFYTLYPGNYIAYSPALTVNKDGIVVLSNPGVKLMDSSSLPTIIYELRGCFFKATGQLSEDYEPTNVAATNATISASGGNYNIMAYTASQYYSTTTKPAEWQYVQSKDRDAYPDSGEQDNYEYVYLGIPFDNAVEPAKVEVGSYTGTGTYGTSNPNSITCSSKIIALLMIGTIMSDSYLQSVYMKSVTTSYASNGLGYSSFGKKSEDGKTYSWYSTSSASGQFNESGKEFYYLAICS